MKRRTGVVLALDETDPDKAMKIVSDVSEYIDKKLEMLECHESQVVWMRDHDGIDFPDMVKTCSRYRGYQCGAEYAEGFRQAQYYLKGTTKRLLP